MPPSSFTTRSSAATLEGQVAFLAGKGLEWNPYHLNTESRAEWTKGWVAAREEAEGEE